MEAPSIWKSRKFWLSVADVVVSTAVYFLTAYLKPDMADKIIWVIGTWQPIVIALIVTYTVQNVEAMRQ